MSRIELPPPPAPLCLEGAHPSSQKGGTLIAEDVTDLQTHIDRLCDPDGYRPRTCNNCGHDVLHVHDYRDRVLAAEPGQPHIRVIRYQCANCKGTWRILPAFVARHLWRSWRVVEAQTLDEAPPRSWPTVPKRTRRRWVARLRSAARHVVERLAASGCAVLEELAARLGLDATREQLVRAHGAAVGSAPGWLLAELAARVHRLAAVLRLM